MLLTKGNTIKDSDKEDWTNRIILLNPRYLGPGYKDVKYQFWKAERGFGCKPNLRGKSIWVICLHDGELARWSRGEFFGIAKNQVIEQYKDVLPFLEKKESVE